MSFLVTTRRDIVKPLQFVAEGTSAATYGVTPTSPTFIAAGINTEITLDPNILYEKILALGLEDYADSIKTQENYAFSLKSKIFNTTLAKQCVNAVSAAGTAAEHLSFLYSKYIDGTEYFTRMVGCRPISATLSVSRALWELDMTWHTQEIKDEVTAHGLTSPTFITAVPTNTPLIHSDAANPFTWNAIVYPERRFSMTVTRDLSLLEINGNVLVQFSKVANRNISFNIDSYKKSTILLTDYYDQTKRTASYKIGASEVMTFTSAVITDYSESHSGSTNDAAIESLTCEAKAVNIA